MIKKDSKYYILYLSANFCQFPDESMGNTAELNSAAKFTDIPEDVKTKALKLGCYAVDFDALNKAITYRSFYFVAIKPNAFSHTFKNTEAKIQSGITWIELDLLGSRPQLLNILIEIEEYSDKVGGWTLYPVSEDPEIRKKFTFGMANCDMSGFNYWEEPVFFPPGKYYFVLTCFSLGPDGAKITFTSDDQITIKWKPVAGSYANAKKNYQQLMDFVRKDLESDTESISESIGSLDKRFKLYGYRNMPKKVFNLLKIEVIRPSLTLRSGTQLELSVDNGFYREYPDNCASCFKSSKSPNPIPVYVCRLK